MAAEKILTEASCKAVKPKNTVYYLNDGAGLRLRVRPDGSRTWVFRYKLDGKETSTGLGAYPTVSLQVARAKALEAKQHISKGDNASTAKRLAKANQIIDRIKLLICLDPRVAVIPTPSRTPAVSPAITTLAISVWLLRLLKTGIVILIKLQRRHITLNPNT